jgi:hypothetical protein
MRVEKLLLVVVMSSAGACGGTTGLGELVGTWQQTDVSDNEFASPEKVRLVVDRDGVVGASGPWECAGRAERVEGRYRLAMDCGGLKGVGTVTVQGGGDRLTVSWPDGSTEHFARSR